MPELKLPDFKQLNLIQSNSIQYKSGIILTANKYKDNLSKYITFTLLNEDKPFAIEITPANAEQYTRYDLFRDNSFIMYKSGKFSSVPVLLLTKKIKIGFGF